MAALLFAVALGAGCTSVPTPPPIDGEPIGLQILRVEPQLKQQRFITLLDFEAERDAIFVVAQPAPATIEKKGGHTGRGILALPRSTQVLTIRLPMLLGTRPFPGDWALAGAYMQSSAEESVEVTYECGGEVLAQRTVSLAPDRWTPVMLELAPISDPNRPPPSSQDIGLLHFKFARPTSAAVYIDDAMLIDNTLSLVGDMGNSTGPWSIRRRGFRIHGDHPGRFNFTLATPEASADGWVVEEATEMRARFSSRGPVKYLTVYADGRAYWDGEYRPMSGQDPLHAIYKMQHGAPAQIQVPEELGRLNRNAPGDANNDGYNEMTGAYQLIANGPRLEARILPRTHALVRPVFEIEGLPVGKVLVTLEGQLVEKTQRLDSGNLLVELPAKIERAATVHFRVQ